MVNKGNQEITRVTKGQPESARVNQRQQGSISGKKGNKTK